MQEPIETKMYFILMNLVVLLFLDIMVKIFWKMDLQAKLFQ